ncbi:hypothetical protein [Sansalvadorimonas verongulae]|uniref:hypothetical protein n=1 Tax=Sansalvadorimonas verongulae TaxID=2172824 RepID=UPI0012BD2A92|nr:hypothetical protein [Sansalvadorimonas verongulae]MTI11927.1 hypothetical protein [Sansalvadorimonas verongulae]
MSPATIYSLTLEEACHYDAFHPGTLAAWHQHHTVSQKPAEGHDVDGLLERIRELEDEVESLECDLECQSEDSGANQEAALSIAGTLEDQLVELMDQLKVNRTDILHPIHDIRRQLDALTEELA